MGWGTLKWDDDSWRAAAIGTLPLITSRFSSVVIYIVEGGAEAPTEALISWLRARSAPRKGVQARGTRIERFKTLQNHCFASSPAGYGGETASFRQLLSVCHRQLPSLFAQG